MVKRRYTGHVKTPDQLTTKLLDQTIELMFRVYLIRGSCSSTARALLARNPEHSAVEHCAHLDDALAGIYRNLQHTVRDIQKSRRVRKRRKA